MPVPVVDQAQEQLRCTGCGRRLADYVNQLESGTVVLEIKRPKCGTQNRVSLRSKYPTEVHRGPTSSAPGRLVGLFSLAQKEWRTWTRRS